jgi:hypothetical protein
MFLRSVNIMEFSILKLCSAQSCSREQKVSSSTVYVSRLSTVVCHFVKLRALIGQLEGFFT